MDTDLSAVRFSAAVPVARGNTPARRPLVWALSALLSAGAAMGSGHALAAVIFKDADLALGQKLIAEHKCVACHISKVGGDGSAMYKPQGKINTAGLLRGMVEMCNTTMNLGLFPEEVTAVAAVLNRNHYRFK